MSGLLFMYGLSWHQTEGFSKEDQSLQSVYSSINITIYNNSVWQGNSAFSVLALTQKLKTLSNTVM